MIKVGFAHCLVLAGRHRMSARSLAEVVLARPYGRPLTSTEWLGRSSNVATPKIPRFSVAPTDPAPVKPIRSSLATQCLLELPSALARSRFSLRRWQLRLPLGALQLGLKYFTGREGFLFSFERAVDGTTRMTVSVSSETCLSACLCLFECQPRHNC